MNDQRTTQQNKALHKMFSDLADELNEKGLTMKVVLKPEAEIRWTGDTIKEYLWKPVQRVLLKKQSTTELTTTEVDMVFETIQHHLGEKFGLELVFPSAYEKENNTNG